MELRYYILRLKQNVRRLKYNISNFSMYALSVSFFRSKKKVLPLNVEEKNMINDRVNYYNRMTKCCVDESWTKIENYVYNHKNSSYFFDLYRILRYFPKKYQFSYTFGDVISETKTPSFTKSRPIVEGNINNVLMKLNRFRHFYFVNDKIPFEKKKNMVVFRVYNLVKQRQKIIEMYHDHPLCDLEKVYRGKMDNYLTISEQLNYKFILCLEGNDVATNLKWVMSSNSLAVMPRPKFETWFMEGRLIANYHYVEIRDDFSDLIEKIQYYISHPDKAEAIARNAQQFVAQFRDKRIELITQIMVAQKYFQLSGQENK